jgi:hypothetical protein
MVCLGKEYQSNPRRCLMKKLYAGIDLHGNNNYLGILDRKGKKVFKKKPIGNQRRRDFVLFGNHLGVRFLEVKNWLIDQIEEADSQHFNPQSCMKIDQFKFSQL